MDFELVDPAAGIDRPPLPHEGSIDAVHMDYVNHTTVDRHDVPCRSCGELVHQYEPHVLAMVWLRAPVETTRVVTPRFCSAACWAEWASGGPPRGPD